jgi:FkbM family methyltransferase
MVLNKIMKNFKLIRKAFLTDFLKFHYSQFGEDIVLKELLKKDKLDGFFVDVGCYHPKKYSNTYMLYRKGWRGINIDMEEDKISLFKMARPLDYNIVCPVSDKREEVTLFRFSKYGLGSTINREYAAETSDEIFDKKTVETKTINEIIDDSPYKGKQIDVLSIDVEGMDFKVLNALDFGTYKPKLIIIEDHHKSIEEVLKTDIYNLLINHSYVLRSWTFYSLIFVLPGADILKDRENA